MLLENLVHYKRVEQNIWMFCHEVINAVYIHNCNKFYMLVSHTSNLRKTLFCSPSLKSVWCVCVSQNWVCDGTFLLADNTNFFLLCTEETTVLNAVVFILWTRNLLEARAIQWVDCRLNIQGIMVRYLARTREFSIFQSVLRLASWPTQPLQCVQGTLSQRMKPTTQPNPVLQLQNLSITVPILIPNYMHFMYIKL